MQAQTVARRYAEASEVWSAPDASIAENGLPERVADELLDASIGFRIRRSTYVRRAQVDVRTASRDLLRMTEDPYAWLRGRLSEVATAMASGDT
jgi:hypothetical protein